jgi:molecular chaperone GrpE
MDEAKQDETVDMTIEQPEAEPTLAETEPSQPGPDPKDVEIASLKDRLLRLQADFDNFRKRTIRDREDQARRATETILKDVLPVIDHFELGVASAHKHHVKHAVIEGFENVLKQLRLALEKSGVTPIETQDQLFDPRLHECITQMHSEEHPVNSVIQETRKGYKLGTFVLRAAQVIVSTGPAPESAPPEPPAQA